MVAGRRKEDCVFRLPALYTGVYFMNQEKKTKKSDRFFAGRSIAPALLRREPLKDKPQADAGAGDAERPEYIPRKCIKNEYIPQITHKDTN